MNIEHRLEDLVILSDEPITTAIEKLNRNKRGIVLCVDPRGVLEGLLTDGDLRRWLVTQDPIDLSQPASAVARVDYVSLPAATEPDEIARRFDERIRQIPLVDERGRVVALADRRRASFQIADRPIGDDAPVFVVAEIGINHNGQVDIARRLIDEAAEAGADCAKFQMRDLPSLYRNAGDATDVREDLGSQYTLDLLSRFELEPDEMYGLFDYCTEQGLIPLCTPWDLTTVDRLEHYGLQGYKLASADLTHHELIRRVAATGKPMILSTGMSTESEIRETVGLLERLGAIFALLHCNSTYPPPYRDLHMQFIERLREISGGPVGYSGHERGWHITLAAVTLGARIIEKHFTLDRNMEGTDHKVSLLPEEFASMVTAIRDVEEALGYEGPREPSQGELMNRVTLAKSVVAARPINEGQVIDRADLATKGPGRGLQPNRLDQLVGRVAKRSMAEGAFLYPSDLDDEKHEPRPFAFRRPWGVPVRYHDLADILAKAAPDFVEFHLSYTDLDSDWRSFVQGGYDCSFAVHSPDLFPGDHILNLAERDDAYRRRSIDELARVLDLTRAMRENFTFEQDPVVICSLGGFTKDRPLDVSERPALYELVAASLDQLDLSGLRFCAQTLPPFPWYMGGQLYCNLFVDADDTAEFCRTYGHRLCLDVSHTKLAANDRDASFREYVETLAPHADHLHLVDAAGLDGEGLQILDGEIDWPALAAQLDLLCPSAGFIPEIWQGHKNAGEGFWIALDRLERWF
jgi:N-acetylneuraminate synthase